MKTACWRWDPVSPNTSQAGCPEPGFGSRAIPRHPAFNPLSLAATLESYAAQQEVVPEELGCRNGLWFHYGFHGAFSDGSQKMALSKMNLARRAGASALREADRVILTFGTAWVYELRSTGEIVANCHSNPQHSFGAGV